jgi:xanthine dehydrogenase molybdenum-binding subunit
MSESVGKKKIRVDAYEKATGRAKYMDDLCDRSALIVRILHSTIAHGYVKSVDTSEAEQIPGVVKILTCFDAPERPFPTAGHPWSTDPKHQDVADRMLLNRHVRYYGDDVAAVIAEDEVAAAQAVRALKVEYEELPFVLDVQEAMKDGAPQLHEDFDHNILAHTSIRNGDYEKASQEPGLIKVEGWYDTPTVQHCHIENHGCFAYEEAGRVVVVSSTQIPHIVRRVVGQALGLPWGKVRLIKPYIGGGFGNKQDALYEPLCAWCSTQVGGRLVKLECSREETFVSNRVRHAIRTHIISWVRPDGTFAARKIECFSNQGAYASHGHGVCAKGMGAFPQLYPCPNVDGDAYTVYTNRPAAGAMRGYGIPQAMFAGESHIDDVCKAIGADPMEFRRKHLMPVGYVDGFSKNELYSDTFNQCMDKGMKAIDYRTQVRGVQESDRSGAQGRWPCGVLVQHSSLADFAGVLFLPHGAQSGRFSAVPDRRDGNRTGLRHCFLSDGGGCRGHSLRGRPRGFLSGYRCDALRHRRLRFPADLYRRLLHHADGCGAAGADFADCPRADPDAGFQSGSGGRQDHPQA